MRILVLSIYYPPEPGANARIVSELAREWTRLGHDVTVLTDIPHYPDDRVPPEYQNGKRHIEEIDGVKVIRNPLIIRDRASTMGRLANNLSFALSAVWGWWRKGGKADVIYVYSPPIFLGIGAWLIKLFARAPVVFNVQDIYPDVAIAHGFLTNRFLIRAFEFFERWVYKRSKRVTVISHGFRDNLLSKGVPDSKIDIIPNCVDPNQFLVGEKYNEFRRELEGDLPPGEKFIVLYGGNLGHAQGLETIIEAGKILDGKRDDIEFVIVGDGVEGPKLRELHERLGCQNVRFTGQVPRAKMPDIVSAADACVVILRPEKSKIWIQSKTYEIMASGRPIIASIDEDGDNYRLVHEAGAGVHATPGDPEALAKAVCKLADDRDLCESLGAAGRKHINENYTLGIVGRCYVESMERAVGRRREPEGRRPLRLAIINQFYPPDLSPTAQLTAGLAEHRAAQGDQVTVVASRGGYVTPHGAPPPPRTHDPRVCRLWTAGLGKATVFRRFLDNTTFYLLAMLRMITLPRQNMIVSLTTPPCIAWTAVLHKFLHPSTKLILWNMDCYPDVAERTNTIRTNGLLARLMRRRNRAIFRKLDHLICLDDAMAKLMCSQYATQNRELQVTVVPNWGSKEFFDHHVHRSEWLPAEEYDLKDRFVVLYLGNAGYGHRFDSVMDAAEMLKDENVVFLFVGGGSRWESIARVKRERGLDNIILHEAVVPKAEIPEIMTLADCALTVLRDDMLGAMSPSKIHSNLAMGLPVIYVGPRGSNVDVCIDGYDCGISLGHDDVQALVDFIRQLKNDEGFRNRLVHNARHAFEDAYCDAVCMPRYDQIIESVAYNGTVQNATTAIERANA